MFWFNKGISGVLSVVVASILWGTTGTAASFIPDVSPLATGAFAMGMGGILLLLNAQGCLRQDRKLLFAQPKLLLVGGLSVVIYPLAFYTTMRLSGVAIGTVISIASAPFFTVLLERLISKKSIRRKWVISFVFGALGVIFLTIGKQTGSKISAPQSLQFAGILLGLVAGLTYAIYSWAARQMIEKGVSSKASMAGMFGLAAVFLLSSLLFTGENLFSDVSHISVAVYMAVVPMFLGYLLFGYGLKYIDASKATLITLLEPAIATLFAVVIIGEKFLTIGWVGMGCIAICLLLQVITLPVKTHRKRMRHCDPLARQL